ncbi:hypothetical protein BDN72DRAFT_609503 [Pluteus cervinus]|uniref:Uncharacterized protein n=1 Tax=Pluteus cervinus TaxID=181527 RepID=A0ACD3AU71_9AGAR|nr:hypothetical protein BDN72DRAFT_609503 [Pluteus cervinus]
MCGHDPRHRLVMRCRTIMRVTRTLKPLPVFCNILQPSHSSAPIFYSQLKNIGRIHDLSRGSIVLGLKTVLIEFQSIFKLPQAYPPGQATVLSSSGLG